ncbi:hypothetical protein [Hymenobacter sp. BT491]|uniref:hypothetical protein n=1 Tax=Hymenobacter sp. BT491 TaxID=2766779 RepID=UPI0016537FF3|nr:hypothetical protein [Hymenobacter sp. BT491]MBC6991604.1 hypothetical protein [Hymenobacter sp. BT491]
MKLFSKSAVVLLLGLLLAGVAAPAQAQVSINIQTPGWGPPVRSNAQYYYIPEIDAYYDLYDRSYVFFDGVNWLRSYQLPVAYQGYDPYQFHPVVIDYIGAQPWGYIRDHRLRYRSGYAYGYGQPRVVVAQPYYGAARGGYYNQPRAQYREPYGRSGNYGGNYSSPRPDYDRHRDNDRGNNGNGYGRENGGYDRGNGNNGNGRGNNEGRNSQGRYGRGR